MTEDISAQERNLEFWMREMPPEIKDIPLIYLAIPGSHDSMTYGITNSSTLAPDAEPVLHKLYPLFKGAVLRWTKTQSIDAFQQLLIGIRYFDLRLATKTGSESFFFTHGLYAEEISKALQQVDEFIRTHPGEVVILDFQHFYGFTNNDHHSLIRYLINLFGPRLVPREVDHLGITLHSLERAGAQVLLIYRHHSAAETREFWFPRSFPSPWPRKHRLDDLLYFLENVNRTRESGFIHQAVLTPTPTFIALRWVSSLRDKCAKPVMKEIYPKLAQFSPGPPSYDHNVQAPVNIVIADFIEMENAVFSKLIIQLNYKLLPRIDTGYHSLQ